MTPLGKIRMFGLVLMALTLGGSNAIGLSADAQQSYAFQGIDVHAHLYGRPRDSNWLNRGAAAIAQMDQLQVQQVFLAPPPFFSDTPGRYECSEFSSIFNFYARRFRLLCGGGTLQPLLHQAITTGTFDVSEFKNHARELANIAGFVGFGEIAAHHACPGLTEYFDAPPDHELFKALVDVASEFNVPISFHMEPITQDTVGTHGVCRFSSQLVRANVPGFKNLLSYAAAKSPPVRIVWEHVGWDTTGFNRPELADELLGAHDNLYAALKQASSTKDGLPNWIVDDDGNIKPEWLAL